MRVDADAHEGGGVLVLGDGADGLADLGGVDQVVEADQHEHGGDDDDDRLDLDVDDAWPGRCVKRGRRSSKLPKVGMTR